MEQYHGKTHHNARYLARRTAVQWGLGFVLLLVATTLAADSFRCGRKVVRTGDTEEALRARCGEPQRSDSGSETLWLPDGHQRVRVQRWYYKTAAGRLERIVLLYRGEVVAVRTGSR